MGPKGKGGDEESLSGDVRWIFKTKEAWSFFAVELSCGTSIWKRIATVESMQFWCFQDTSLFTMYVSIGWDRLSFEFIVGIFLRMTGYF